MAGVELSAHVREEIDRWRAKFPEGRQRRTETAACEAGIHVGWVVDPVLATRQQRGAQAVAGDAKQGAEQP